MTSAVARFLGIEGNGWTWLLFAGAGLILLVSAPMHWGAKSMAMIVGLAMAAAAVLALVDGSDVLGVFAANGATVLAFARRRGGAAAGGDAPARGAQAARGGRRRPPATGASTATGAAPRSRRARTGARSARHW